MVSKYVSLIFVGISSRYREVEAIYKRQILSVSDIYIAPDKTPDTGGLALYIILAGGLVLAISLIYISTKFKKMTKI